ncbi:hypothetical protein [Streptomyces sp. NPDC096030]|uniref:hypothetical protein n=1 Tax=Streptomyces sp. NPDC096030 TaxID=3155423 RepID=UPI00332CAE6A
MVPVSASSAEWDEAVSEAHDNAELMYDGYVELALAGPASVAVEAERLWLRVIRAVDQAGSLWARRDPADVGAVVSSLLVDDEPDRTGQFAGQQKKLIRLAREQPGGDVADC